MAAVTKTALAEDDQVDIEVVRVIDASRDMPALAQRGDLLG